MECRGGFASFGFGAGQPGQPRDVAGNCSEIARFAFEDGDAKLFQAGDLGGGIAAFPGNYQVRPQHNDAFQVKGSGAANAAYLCGGRRIIAEFAGADHLCTGACRK